MKSIVKRNFGLATQFTDFARLILLQWMVIVAVGTPIYADPPLTVVLHPVVQVESGTMTMGKIAQVFGTDIEQVARLEKVSLGRVPALGSTVILSRGDINRYCQRAGFEKEEIDYSGSDEVEVSTACDLLTPEMLTRLINQYLEKQFTPQGIQYSWKYGKDPEPEPIPVGATVEVIQTPGSRLQGTVLLQLGVRCQESLEQRLSVRIEVSTHETLWVAKEAIPRNTIITSSLVEAQPVETTWLVGNPRTQVESIIGCRAKRTINAGRVITTEMIDIPYAVRRGDLVTINAYGEGVVARVNGQARQNGRPGDWILVVNLLTNSKIKAQVVDEQSVVIP